MTFLDIATCEVESRAFCHSIYAFGAFILMVAAVSGAC